MLPEPAPTQEVEVASPTIKLKPLEQFICDYCGYVINSIEDGWVEWLTEITEDGFREHGFKIVHHAPSSPRRESRDFEPST
jgi:hypothetical protein